MYSSSRFHLCKRDTRFGNKKEEFVLRILRKDKLYEPIKVGDYGDFYYGDKNAVCSDCGAKYGEPHKPGCDNERCPRCGKQLVTCKCGEIYEVDNKVNEDEVLRIIGIKRKAVDERRSTF